MRLSLLAGLNRASVPWSAAIHRRFSRRSKSLVRRSKSGDESPHSKASFALGLFVFWSSLALAAPARGQFDADPLRAPGGAAVQRWRFGVVLTASGGAFKGITATTTVPTDWPEQRVRVVGKDVSPGVKISEQPVEEFGRQMVVRIPYLASGVEARAIVTYEIQRRAQSAPEDTDIYLLPDPKRLQRKMAVYLAPGPLIESAHPEIKAAAKQVGADEPKAWERVKAIYLWVKGKIEYEDNRGKEIKSAAEALQAGKGDCDEITSLFVAVCRAAGIPARTVRVPGHCYPEFYLLDDQGEGHWFPCESTGAPIFGAMPNLRPILQKGDNVLLPAPEARSKRKIRYRFFPDEVRVADGPRGTLEPQFICEPVK